MSAGSLPNPHLEIERADGPGEPWKWSIYDGQGGLLIQSSEHRYPTTDAAKRAGDKAVLVIRTRMPPDAGGGDL